MAGTAFAGVLGSVAFEKENSFADAADNTVTTALRVRDDQIDVTGLLRPMVSRGGVFPRMNESDTQVIGAFNVGTFTTTFDLGGHGATSVASLTETDLAKLLAFAVGNSDWTQIGDAALVAASSTVTSLEGFGGTAVAGGLWRVGDLGDTRAEGQGSIANANADPLQLGVAIGAAPADGDNAYAHGMIYPVSNVSSGGIITADDSDSSNTVRFLLYTANGVFVARGCVCTGITITGLNPGEIPQIALEWSAAAWGPLGSITFPPTESTDAKPPVPTAAGSFFINSVGTTTRVTDNPVAITFNVGQGMVPVPGPGGETVGQNVVGWRRKPEPSTLSVTFEAQAQTATPTYWLTANPTVARHALYTLNPVDGAAVSFYWPRLIQTNNPLQEMTEEINTVTVEFECATGATTTSELTLSAWRMGL